MDAHVTVGARCEHVTVTLTPVHRPQPWTLKLYSAIEDWWGEELSPDLADKASNAPAYQIAAFAEHLASAKLMGWAPPLVQMPPGILRPLVGTNLIQGYGSQSAFSSGIALRLLLYVHEVVLESEPLSRLLLLNRNQIDKDARKIIRDDFTELAILRPFAQRGLLHFTIVHSPALHPAYSGWENDALSRPGVRQFAQEVALKLGASAEDANDEMLLRGVLRNCFSALKIGLLRMSAGTANPLTRTPAERELLRALMSQQMSDRRQSLVGTLAQLPVPDFTNDPKLLTTLRESDDKFEAWRQKLGAALSHVGDLPDSSNFDEATDIVRTELSSALSGINASTKQSPVLRAANQGIVQFGVGAIGAVSSGLITGNPITGALIGAASTQLGAVAINSLKGLREKRSDRLVLALAASFDTQNSGSG